VPRFATGRAKIEQTFKIDQGEALIVGNTNYFHINIML